MRIFSHNIGSHLQQYVEIELCNVWEKKLDKQEKKNVLSGYVSYFKFLT